MTYFLIAGEASGDLHASRLIEALRQQDSAAQFVGLGGDQMAKAGCTLVRHYREMAYMGIVPVLRNLDKVLANFRIARAELLKARPDVLILIDYPSFNLRMAAFCRRHLPATKIAYYIPPKVWAWKKWRVHRIARLSDLILGIFPFEPDFYARYGYTCHYVGNPSAEQLANRQTAKPPISKPTNRQTDTVVLVPGSRQSEVQHCLPTMLAAARRHFRHIVITAAPSLSDNIYTPYLREGEVLTRDTHTAIASADLAIVNSGTATLETALIGTPQIAVYHLACSWLLHLLRPIQRTVFPLPWFTLPNIILGRTIIPELLADDFTEQRLSQEIDRMQTVSYAEVSASYQQLREVLGTKKAATEAAALIRALG